jgi:HK97 family phage major capsid protein
MDKLLAFKKALEDAVAEARSALDAGDKDAIEKARAKVAEARETVDREVELREAEATANRAGALGKPKGDERQLSAMAELRAAMTEKRALTVNGTGAVSVVREMVAKLTILGKFRYFYGANASTVVPILAPGLAVPAGQSEGATGVASDATAVLGPKAIQPKAYVSVLPVSAEALLMSGANIESELPKIFGDAFGAAMAAGAISGNGSGNNMLGMFGAGAIAAGNQINCGAAGAPKLADILKLALQLQDFTDEGAIVINQAFINTMLAEASADLSWLKEEIGRSKSVLGIPLILTSRAPTTITASSLVAIGMPLSNYGVAIANEMEITPIKVKGDTNTYFQATMFFHGTTIVTTNGWALKTI